MSSKESLSGYESESSMLSPSSYLEHTMEYVVCETIPFSVSESNGTQNQYFCNICNTKMSQLQEFRSHLFNHVGAIPYFCTLCNFADISLTQLFIHLLSHKEFLNNEEKLAKLKDVFNKMVYSCNLCFFSFKNNKDLATHYLKHITNSYKCKSCKFVFFTETELLIHGHIHSLSLVCRVCDKTFPSSQKIFLSHVLSHDYTRLYRNFPKIGINHQDVPFYKSFFEICSQVINIDFPMYCGILKTPHKNLSKTKPPSLKDESWSSPIIQICDDQRPPSLDQEAIASPSKIRKSSEESDLRSDVFKLPDYPWKTKSQTDSIPPVSESNQAGIQISIPSVVGSRGRNTSLETSVKMENRSPSPLKGSALIAEEKRNDIPIIKHAYSLNQQIQNTEVLDTSNAKENIVNESINNQDETHVSIPKCYISINYSNTSNNHLITDIKEEILDDTDEECPNGNELRSEHTTNASGLDKFSVFSKSEDFVRLSDVKHNSSMNNSCQKEIANSSKRRKSSTEESDLRSDDKGVEPGLVSDKRRVSVLLERLPKEIVSVANTENTMDMDFESPKSKPAFCFKELLVVIPKLPNNVKDMASFRRYERKQKKVKIQISTPRVTRSTRSSQNSNFKEDLKVKKYGSNVIKLNLESISIHNADNISPLEGMVDSSVKDTREHLDCIKTKRRDTSPFPLSHETSVNNHLSPPSTSSSPTCIEHTQNGYLKSKYLDSMMDLDCSEHFCEDGDNCCCTVPDCDSQTLDVEEDISSIRNRILLLKTALNSVQETSENEERPT